PTPITPPSPPLFPYTTLFRSVRTRGRRGFFLAFFSVDGDADDRPRPQDQSRDTRRRVLSADVDAIRAEASGQFWVIVHDERHVVAVAELPKSAGGLDLFLQCEDLLVAKLDDRCAAFEAGSDDFQHPRDGALRGRNQ